MALAPFHDRIGDALISVAKAAPRSYLEQLLGGTHVVVQLHPRVADDPHLTRAAELLTNILARLLSFAECYR